ncbi:splicing factor 3A subunit 3 [Plasmodium brasilianum]|nr:splicing factor 3A subunit 3, putative [Plasmodium malariae]KAI4839476.1 splicing factor 3A subunit 3 [Plasmodium brasilianum]SBT87900.1 splicing factor 3A subunit 3, putative [Plasmodium malariae]
MAQFLIEQIRYIHEEIELIEKAIAELIEEKVKNSKKSILYDYSINYLVEKVQKKSKLLLQYYNDEDNLKKEEMQFISGKTNDEKNDVWKNYYERIKYVKDYHKKTNIKKIEIKSYKLYKNEALKNNNLKELFSPLEKKGKYMDMSKFYNDFINIKKIKEFRMNMFRKKEMINRKKKSVSTKGGGANSVNNNSGGTHNGSGNDVVPNNDGANENNCTSRSKHSSTTRLNEFKEMDLVTYLHNFTRFYYIPRYCKYRNEEYKNYLQNLLHYLMTFFQKINILVDCQKTFAQYEKSFNEKFENKEIKQWEKFTYDLDNYCNINDKLYASEGTYKCYLKSKNYDDDLKKYLKKQYTVEQLQEIKKNIEIEDKEMAKWEYLIELYKNILNKKFQKTVENIQRKQAFTIDEIQKRKKAEKKNEHLLSIKDDILNSKNNGTINGSSITNSITNNGINYDHTIDAWLNLNLSASSSDYDSSECSDAGSNEQEEEEEENEDEKPIYNPLNLPLGYDNKPIPYWLYKLHGLSKEYKCEICGNYSYFGRAMFEKHFYEWRHSFGMKCLNIPNTLHFKEITKIEDALNLYEKLKKQTQLNIFKPDQEVECEDSKGNVMNIKAYDDLKRQGLL